MSIKFILTAGAILFNTSLAFCQDSFKDERYKEVTEYSTRLTSLEGKEYDQAKKWIEANKTVHQIQQDSAKNYDEIMVVAVTRLKRSETEFYFSKEKLKLQVMGTNSDEKLVTIFYEFDYDLVTNKVASKRVMQRIHY
jgi:hypothetical protein